MARVLTLETSEELRKTSVNDPLDTVITITGTHIPNGEVRLSARANGLTKSDGVKFDNYMLVVSLPDDEGTGRDTGAQVILTNADMSFMPYLVNQQLEDAVIRVDFFRRSNPDVVEFFRKWIPQNARVTRDAITFNVVLNGSVPGIAVKEHFSSLTTLGLYPQAIGAAGENRNESESDG